MAPARQVAFELERFEWLDARRLEVVGRWNGLRGRKLGRPVLAIEAGGRRHALAALPGGQLTASDDGEPWRATFAWDGGMEDVPGAELEVGRSLVVDLPAPGKRRRRVAGVDEHDLRAEIAELRSMVSELRAQRAAAPEPEEVQEREREADELRDALATHEREATELREALAEREAELDRAREALANQQQRDEHERERLAEELGVLRLAHGSLRAAHEQLEDETETLRAAEAERDRLAAELEEAHAAREGGDEARAQLRSEVEALRRRQRDYEAERTQLAAELESAKEELAALRERVTVGEAALAEAREESERALAAERGEVARLRNELAARADQDKSSAQGGEDDASRRMLERMARDLDNERATTRQLRRELDAAARTQQAVHSPAVAPSSPNGSTTTTEEEPVPATPAGRAASAAAAGARTAVVHRRAEAARMAAAQRVPEARPTTVGIWGVRAFAAALVVLLLVALAIIIGFVT